jgi:uncharacterized membrane protein
MTNLHPFDLKSALLAKHAQHVVLIHFPIALYLTGTLFDVLGRVFRKPSFLDVARWNTLSAAVMSIPTAATGILAWRWALERQTLKGILLLHLVLGLTVVVAMWVTVWLRSQRNSVADRSVSRSLLLVEIVVCLIVGLTAHLGGFLSGVNGGS